VKRRENWNEGLQQLGVKYNPLRRWIGIKIEFETTNCMLAFGNLELR